MNEDDIKTELALLESKVNNMHHYLYGNGKPGKLQTIDNKIDDIKNSVVKVHIIIASVAGSGGGLIGYLINSLG